MRTGRRPAHRGRQPAAAQRRGASVGRGQVGCMHRRLLRGHQEQVTGVWAAAGAPADALFAMQMQLYGGPSQHVQRAEAAAGRFHACSPGRRPRRTIWTARQLWGVSRWRCCMWHAGAHVVRKQVVHVTQQAAADAVGRAGGGHGKAVGLRQPWLLAVATTVRPVQMRPYMSGGHPGHPPQRNVPRTCTPQTPTAATCPGAAADRRRCAGRW